MADRETLTLTIHGLPAFNKDVDGEVFARKFFKFMQALAASDETVNGGRRLKYLIERLEKTQLRLPFASKSQLARPNTSLVSNTSATGRI